MMMRLNASRNIARKPSGLATAMAVAVVVSCGLFMPRAAHAQSIEVLRPVANAIVRERVPIRVSPRDVPPDGYVSISIDGDVIVAKILPDKAGDPVFLWDTKQAYVSADDPTTKKFVADGTHDLTVTIYSSGNHLVGSATLPVRVANKISVSPQGAMLRYKWTQDEALNYHRTVTVTEVNDTSTVPGAAPTASPMGGYPGAGAYPGPGGPGGPGFRGYPGAGGPPMGYGGGYPGAGGPPMGYGGGYPGGPPTSFAGGPGMGPMGPMGAGYRGPYGGGGFPGSGFGPGGPAGIGGERAGGDYPIDSADVYFVRSVEDATPGEYLLRDKVSTTDGVVSSSGTSQFVKTAYNIKSKYRTVNDYGEVLSEMPPLSPGDHFAFPIPVLPGRRVNVGDSWEAPIEVSLDWMGSDPLSVTGEARLEDFEWEDNYPVAKIHETFSGSSKFATEKESLFSGAPVEDLKVDQTVYFAYNSGRLIRVEADNDITVDLTSSQEAYLDPFTGHTGTQMAAFGGESGGPGGAFPGAFPGAGGPGGPGGPMGFAARGPMGPGGPMGGPMGGAFRGPGAIPGAEGLGGAGVGEPRAPIHLKISETTELAPTKSSSD